MIQKGDIILQQGTDIGAKIIRAITRGPYSHAAMYIGDGLIAHSTFRTGSVIVYYKTWIEYYAKDDPLDIYRIDNDYDEFIDPVVGWVKENTGKPYDFKGVLGFVIPSMRQNGNTFFCSELIAEAWLKAGGINLCDKPTYRTSPVDLSKSKYLTQIYDTQTLLDLEIAIRKDIRLSTE